MLRKLNRVEEAFTLSNESYPLCVGIVLRLGYAPVPDRLREAVDRLQDRHVLLRSRITTRRRRFVFERMGDDTRIPLNFVERRDSSHWEDVVEREINTYFDPSGPLVRLVHLSNDGPASELILVLHHAIMDGVSARLLLHELLSLCAGEALPPPLSDRDQLSGHEFPTRFRGPALAVRLVPFMLRQTWEGIRYAFQGIKVSPAVSPHNRIIHIAFSPELTRRIAYRTQRDGLSLNAILSAALLLAVRRRLHPATSRSIMRAISFADLRPLLKPPPAEQVLGCMISMLRFAVPVGGETSVTEVASLLWRQMYRSGRSGAPFLFATVSKLVGRLSLLNRRNRMASTALSFLGKLELQPQYGSTRLVDVHAFITNNVAGPELSGFGKTLFGRIELDMTYLASEISEESAHELMSEIEVSLRELAE